VHLFLDFKLDDGTPIKHPELQDFTMSSAGHKRKCGLLYFRPLLIDLGNDLNRKT
jgi:hypothetical protein